MNYLWDFHRHPGNLAEEKESKRPSLLCSAGKDDWEHLLQIAKEAPQHRIALGIHPWSTAGKSECELEYEFKVLCDSIQKFPHAHLGETGLDSLRGGDLELQKKVFFKHLKLAHHHHRLCVIHCVRAYSDLLGILNHLFAKREMPRCMIHFFGGSPQIAAQLSQLGVALSFNITRFKDAPSFKKAQRCWQVSNTSLLESDEEGAVEAEKEWKNVDFRQIADFSQWNATAQRFWNSL